jgi:hypothetical protein
MRKQRKVNITLRFLFEMLIYFVPEKFDLFSLPQAARVIDT